jgi:hypothetical protein
MSRTINHMLFARARRLRGRLTRSNERSLRNFRPLAVIVWRPSARLSSVALRAINLDLPTEQWFNGIAAQRIIAEVRLAQRLAKD